MEFTISCGPGANWNAAITEETAIIATRCLARNPTVDLSSYTIRIARVFKVSTG
jgi:hypothetical protein